MTSKPIILPQPPAESNSAKTLTAADLTNLYDAIQAKFPRVLIGIKRRAQNAQDYAVAMDLFDTAFRHCYTPQQQNALLDSYLEAQ